MFGVLERIIPKVSFGVGCWEWHGALTRGYGCIRCVTARGSRALYVHRLMYEFAYGPIAEGMVIDHLCRNPKCVRPSHLEPVTIRVNVLRGVGPLAEKARQTHCRLGHPLSGDNLRLRRNGRSRECKTCQRE